MRRASKPSICLQLDRLPVPCYGDDILLIHLSEAGFIALRYCPFLYATLRMTPDIGERFTWALKTFRKMLMRMPAVPSIV